MNRYRHKPYYRITEAARQRVELLDAVGQTDEQIADVLKVSVVTLREYFADQLRHGLARKEAELIEKLHDSATKERNGASMRAFSKMITKAKAPSKSARSKQEKRPGIDRPLSNREQNELAKWCHRDTPWAGLIDDPFGETEPQWSVKLRRWLKEQRGDAEPDA